MKALGCGHQDEILSSAFNLKITRQDMQMLRNCHWLNDEVKCIKWVLAFLCMT